MDHFSAHKDPMYPGATRVEWNTRYPGLVIYSFDSFPGVYVRHEDLLSALEIEPGDDRATRDYLSRHIPRTQHGMELLTYVGKATIDPCDHSTAPCFINIACQLPFTGETINELKEFASVYASERRSEKRRSASSESSPALNFLRSVAVDDVLIGRHADNSQRQATVVRIQDGQAQLRHDNGRLSWVSAGTIYDRYLLKNDLSVRLTVDNEDPTDRRATRSKSKGARQPEATTAHAESVTDHGHVDSEVEDDAEPVETVTPGVELAIVNGWSIYTHVDSQEATVRDVDLAKRAGLVNERDIRTTIKDLVGSGEIDEIKEGRIGVGTADANPSPRAYAVDVRCVSGKGRKDTITEYHLNEAATLLVIMRLRTQKAAEIRRAIVVTFVLVRQGRVEEAARVAGAKAPPPTAPSLLETLQTQLDAIERLKSDGVIDSKTASVQYALAVSKATGMDLITPPNVTFGRWNPAAQAANDLAPGESVVITKPVDTNGTLSAEAVAKLVDGASAQLVGRLARELGIFGKDGMGVWVPVQVNGADVRDNWRYSWAASELLTPLLADVVQRTRAIPRVSQGAAIEIVVANHLKSKTPAAE